MRVFGLFLGVLGIVLGSGCGGDRGGNGGSGGSGEGNGKGTGGVDEQACDDCLSAFSNDVDYCVSKADNCASAAFDLYDFGPCYRTFGFCLAEAYLDGSSCNIDCGDLDTADALTCGSYCETDAGDCFGDSSDNLAYCYDFCDTASCFDDCDIDFDYENSSCGLDEDICLSDCGF